MLQPVGIPEPGAPRCPTSPPLPVCVTTATRPAPDLEALAAPPYDVIDEEQRGALEARPRRQRGAAAPPPTTTRRRRSLRPGGAARSPRGSSRGVLAVDSAPRFYSYRMQFRDLHGEPAPHPWGDRRAHASRTRRHEPCSPTNARCPRRSPTGLALLRATRGQRRPDLGPQPRRRASPSDSSPTPCSAPASTTTA